MRTLIRSLPLLALPWLASPALADNFYGGYLGIEGSSVAVQNSLDDDLNPVGVRFKLGAPIADFFDLEGQFLVSADSSSIAFDRLSIGVAGLYLKAYVPLGQRSALFALGGYSWVELEQEVGEQVFSDQRNGVGYGFGLETSLNDRMDLTADYMRYLSREGLFEEITGVNVGLKFYY